MADEGLAASLGATAANGLPWDQLRRVYINGQPPAELPDVGEPAIPAGPQVSPGTAWGNKAAGIGSQLVQGMVNGTAQMLATPGAVAQPNPYPPGSEQAIWYDDQRQKASMNFGPAMALNMIGTGTQFAEPGAFGAGGGKMKTPEPTPEPTPAAAPGSIAEQLGMAVQGPASAIPIKPGDARVSTRFPTAVKSTENPLTHHLSIGTEEMRNAPGFEHNVSLLSDYPGFGRLKGMSNEQAVQAYLDQSRGNMQYLYDRSPADMKQRSPLWYEGAGNVSDALANRWGVPRPSASGAIASLSPQMDWFKNASLAERLGDTMTGAHAGRRMTSEMRDFGNQADFLKGDKNAELFASIQGKSLDQLTDPVEKALWIRLYDEAHNPRHYRSVTPEGEFGDFITKLNGQPAKVGWGALGEIQKAVRSLESGGDTQIISPILGTKHKVRNFYNNIEVPHDPRFGDITADTHQVAAAQLRPLSGSSPAVAHSLGSSLATAKQPPGYRAAKGDSITGVQGTYGLTADATRMMAMENDLLPREAQSATWEPVRELFTAKFKGDKKNTAAVDDIWREYDRGDITIDQARDKIFDFAGGIGTPGYSRPGARATAPQRGSTYR